MLVQLMISSVLLGGVYGIAAVGLSLIFSVMKIVNFAHGDFIMLGMFTSFWLFTLLKIDPFVSIVIVIPLFLVIGIIMQRILIQPILKAPENTQIFITLGLSIVLQNLVLLLWGADFRTARTSYTMFSLHVGGISINFPRLIACIASIISFSLLTFFLKNTDIGKAIRATAMNSDAAQLMGINIKRIYMYTMGIGLALTAGAGCFLITFYFTWATMGMTFGILSFIITVLGGLGSLPGAFVSGFIIGIVQGLGGILISSEARMLAAFIIFIIVLLIRPQGIWGEKVNI